MVDRLRTGLDGAGADHAQSADCLDRKTELIKPRRPWKTLSDVELATAEYVDWYNHRRLHGEIGHVPPVEYETNHYRETTKPQVTVTT
ncbi:IS3 family transposase [Streptomyces sp. NPDC057430]|uniref:IS3 family transposase n=1 Tax=Streptomyces sp. NPDC057430 TaxID=3346131 RepID=UPI00368EB74C